MSELHHNRPITFSGGVLDPERVWRCVCDGRYSGCIHGRTCAAGPDSARGRWSPKYWCEQCDQRRMDHISANLKSIAVAFSDQR